MVYSKNKGYSRQLISSRLRVMWGCFSGRIRPNEVLLISPFLHIGGRSP